MDDRLKMKRLSAFGLVSVAVLLLVFGSGLLVQQQVEGNGLTDLEGRVEIDGSSTVAPITIEAANKFGRECPKVHIPVAVSGTGGGFKRFTRGDTDISNASRPIRDRELEQCRLDRPGPCVAARPTLAARRLDVPIPRQPRPLPSVLPRAAD